MKLAVKKERQEHTLMVIRDIGEMILRPKLGGAK